MPRIVTEQAPSAKPISVCVNATSDWQTMIEVPDYDVPVVGFGSSRRIAPGVGEISSPLSVVNYDTDNPTVSARIDLRIVRGLRPLIAGQTEVDYAEFDGGFGHELGKVIELTNGAIVTILQVSTDGNGVVERFQIDTVGGYVQAVPEPLEQNLESVEANLSPGIGFTLTVAESNLSDTEEHFYLMKGYPIRPFDLYRFPFSGQFLLTRDKLQIRADLDNKVTATISYTEGQAEEDDIPGA